jgi:RHS repeat-associated protein
LVVDVATGAIVQELGYDAWGRVLVDTAPGTQPFGFAGGLYDAETGLVRFGVRDYDAEVGRWTAKDPVEFQDTANLYEYVRSNPVNLFDPSGEDTLVGILVGPLWGRALPRVGPIGAASGVALLPIAAAILVLQNAQDNADVAMDVCVTGPLDPPEKPDRTICLEGCKLGLNGGFLSLEEYAECVALCMANTPPTGLPD